MTKSVPSLKSGLLATLVFSLSFSTVAGSSNTTTGSGSQTFPNHGNPKLVCRPGKWPDVVSFFLLNYIAHAATIKSVPGESTPLSIFNIIAALFFPASGVFRAFDALSRRAKFAKTDLRMAARAGALCTVVKWPDESRRVVKPIWRIFESSIHGSFELPHGYVLAVVPSHSKFVGDVPDKQSKKDMIFGSFRPSKRGKTNISCSYSAVKILVAAMQLVYGSTTMFLSRGDQVDRYGYSAFGLTVAPYVWMSFVNLCANLVCPEYPSLYLVESDALRTLENDPRTRQTNKPLFDGVVGNLTSESEEKLKTKIARHAGVILDKRRTVLWRKGKRIFHLCFLTGSAAVVPLAAIGGISKFRTGSQVTVATQVAVSIWLLYGFYFGVMSRMLMRSFEHRPTLNIWAMGTRAKAARLLVVLSFVLGGTAVFGFVHAGQMIIDYGVCISSS